MASLKYISTAVGLVSAFFMFGSVWYAFAFGVVLFLISAVLEKIVFVHYAGFIHALPLEVMDPAQWVGISFGVAPDPASDSECLSLAMVVVDREFADKMNSLVLEWTHGALDDKERNVGVSIVELDDSSYVFLCFPKMDRAVAQRAFEGAMADLRKSSLEDKLAELHAISIFGKRCHLSPDSPYPDFVARYSEGDPVVLRFGIPYQGMVAILPDIPGVKIHAFRIVSAAKLTNKDFEKEAMQAFLSGGNWQGPPELDPRVP